MKKEKEIRENQIIEAAIDEFIEKGYNRASMEGIALRAGLSKGGLYHHYKSKTEVLFAVNMKFIEPVQEMMSRVESNKNLVEGLKQYIQEYLSYWNEHRRELGLYFLTMNEAFGSPKLLELYKESTQAIFGYFERVFSRGMETGVFSHGDTRERAVAFISCLDGYLGYLLLDPDLQPGKTGAEIIRIFLVDSQSASQ